jgi:RNA polymerase sigma-70 factor (ECF subfamily)
MTMLTGLIPLAWQSDHGLWQEATGGNTRAVRHLVEQLTPKAHALAWRMLGSTHEAEDVVQDAFIKLFGSRSFEGRSSLGTYFHTIVSRLCLDRLKASRTRQLCDDDLSELTDELEPSHLMKQKEEQSEIRQALAKLNPRQRLAMILWAYQDASAEEIAITMDLEVNAAHQLLHRAKQNMKKIMEKEGHHG